MSTNYWHVHPLFQNGCTLQEAAIVASVLAKVKVPLLHSSAALIRLANMEYSGKSVRLFDNGSQFAD